MASRMEKYHGNVSSVGRRSVRNESLYKDMYENTEYSNIEKVATLEKTNEISLEQIQELLKERDNLKNRNNNVKKEVSRVYQAPVDDRSYDIRDILTKAKDEHVDDNKNRNLKNTQYNILRNINIKEKMDSNEVSELEKTLVDSNVLKSYDDSELSLDMLSDLKSTGNTIVEKTNVGDLLQEVQEAKDKYEPTDEDGLDKSFYTSSLGFKDEDFEQLKDLKDSIASNNKMIKVLFFLLFLVIAGVVGFIIFKMM
ncbi:MAG: hypothetical protein ACI31V_06105 [Bacilli bacterium]